MNRPEFSIILPFYKQGDHLEQVISDFKNKLMKGVDTFELIIVVNGVADLPVVEEKKISDEHGVTITRITTRGAGWGFAVKRGLREGAGEYLCYTNSARTNPDELIKLMRYAKVSNDAIVKATRIERENSARKKISVGYNLFNRLILKTAIWDVNATPKVIPRKIMEQISLNSDGDSIDAEFMYKAFKRKIPIIEIPIDHVVRKGGKSTTNWKSAFSMFWGLVEIKMKGSN